MNLLSAMLSVRTKEKLSLFSDLEKIVNELDLKVVHKEQDCPWGGFLMIDESQAEYFGKLFFKQLTLSLLSRDGRLKPRILVVEPGKGLPYHRHRRRAEVWRVVSGRVRVVIGKTKERREVNDLSAGQMIFLEECDRHRLEGLSVWGVVAEIGQHVEEELHTEEKPSPVTTSGNSKK